MPVMMNDALQKGVRYEVGEVEELVTSGKGLDAFAHPMGICTP